MLWRPGEHPGQPTEATGALWACRRRAAERGWTVVEGTCAYAMPGGPVPQPVYEALRDEILEQLRAALPLDVVALGLHGAMVADSTVDCEGDLLARARAIVGPQVALGALLDCHAHHGAARQQAADVLVYFKAYPHDDYVERGEELLDLLERTRRGEIRPVMHATPCRMLAGFPTRTEPMKSFVARMRALEQGPVLSVSLVHGFPAADLPDAGAQVLVVTDGDEALARQTGQGLARELFALRHQLRAPRRPMSEVLQEALQHTERPVLLADVDDNPGGGASGDATTVLALLLEQGIGDTCLGPLWDPQAVRFCFDAGVGAQLALRIGGKVGPASGQPLDVRARVLALRADHAQVVRGVRAPLGDCAAVEVRGIEVVLCSVRDQAYEPGLFAGLGIDCAARRFIVVKSAQQYHLGFDAVTAVSLPLRSADRTARSYTCLNRPMWPLDEEFELP
jgi:microcystin degradation protein MlrC